jgi:hypothetical protein
MLWCASLEIVTKRFTGVMDLLVWQATHILVSDEFLKSWITYLPYNRHRAMVHSGHSASFIESHCAVGGMR